MTHPTDATALGIALAVLWAAALLAYLLRAALAPWIGQALCRLGIHELAPRRLVGPGTYWLTCSRHCGHTEARVDRRRA